LNHSLIARFAAALILALTAESSFSADIVIHAEPALHLHQPASR
jgi:hypothetical protein